MSELELLDNWTDSPAVPDGWTTASDRWAVRRVPIKNKEFLKVLKATLAGKWHKVYRKGEDGTEIHYFQHQSGKVTHVKHKE